MDNEDDAASSVLQDVVVDPFISRELQEDFKSTAFFLLWRAFKQGGGEREHAWFPSLGATVLLLSAFCIWSSLHLYLHDDSRKETEPRLRGEGASICAALEIIITVSSSLSPLNPLQLVLDLDQPRCSLLPPLCRLVKVLLLLLNPKPRLLNFLTVFSPASTILC
jgi:hypothetical protein